MMDFRTLNYLGSKLRLLDFIEDNVFNVTRRGSGVCDLFAGSGCVAYKLSQSFSVTACDIQGYSKVICDALLRRFNVSKRAVSLFLKRLDSTAEGDLYWAFHPLMEMEESAIRSGNSKMLANILEHGSVKVFDIEHGNSPIADELQMVDDRLHNSGLVDEKSLISRYYGGVYFSYRQSVQIDIILDAIQTIVEPENRNLFLAALLSTASDIVDTVGKHFAQPIKARDSNGKVKSLVWNKARQDKMIDVFGLYKEWLLKYLSLPKSKYHFTVIQGDSVECIRTLPKEVATIYADPPYTRDHYSRFYHVLETMVLRDSPDVSTVSVHGRSYVSKGIYRTNRHQSDFCIKSRAPLAFEEMFCAAAMTDRNLLLSYSPYDETKKTHPRVVTMRQLVALSEKYYRSVKIVSAGSFRHNKLNSTGHLLEASDEAEVLIVCTNKK